MASRCSSRLTAFIKARLTDQLGLSHWTEINADMNRIIDVGSRYLSALLEYALSQTQLYSPKNGIMSLFANGSKYLSVLSVPVVNTQLYFTMCT